MLVRLWKSWNPHTLLMGMQNRMITLENSLEVSPKVKMYPYHMTQIPYDPVFAPKKGNIYLYKKLSKNVDSSFVHKSPTLEAQTNDRKIE